MERVGGGKMVFEPNQARVLCVLFFLGAASKLETQSLSRSASSPSNRTSNSPAPQSLSALKHSRPPPTQRPIPNLRAVIL